MANPKVVVVGSSNTDMVTTLKRLPAPGETLLADDFIMAAGGKGANQAVAAAKLGGAVTFVARVGSDIFGEQSLQNFKDIGINTDFIVKDDENPSGVALIFVDKEGENVIVVASGANGALSKQDVEAAKAEIENASTMLLQLEIPIETVRYAAQIAYESGVKVILNPAPAAELDEELLSTVTVLTPNEPETELLTGVKVEDEKSAKKAADILREKGATNVIITMGTRGAFMVTSKEAKLIPTKKVKAVDTTAAGDAFNGALAYALAKGESMDKAILLANKAGAFSATKMGAQPSMPTLEELQEFV